MSWLITARRVRPITARNLILGCERAGCSTSDTRHPPNKTPQRALRPARRYRGDKLHRCRRHADCFAGQSAGWLVYALPHWARLHALAPLSRALSIPFGPSCPSCTAANVQATAFAWRSACIWADFQTRKTRSNHAWTPPLGNDAWRLRISYFWLLTGGDTRDGFGVSGSSGHSTAHLWSHSSHRQRTHGKTLAA